VDQVYFGRLLPDAIEPTRKFPDDAGADVYAHGDYIIHAHTFKIVRTGVIVVTPNKYMCLIKPKGKSNYLIGAGVVDTGYAGEILVKIFNVLNEDIIIRHGEPVAQLIFVRIATPEFLYNDKVEIDSVRGATGGIVTQYDADRSIVHSRPEPKTNSPKSR